MPVMFSFMSNLALKLFLGPMLVLNVCFVVQTCLYTQQSEQMSKWASNAVDVSPTHDIIC